MLALEWEVPGGAGTIAHFFAVSSYVLQHPDSMRYTVESLAWLKSAVTSALSDDVSTVELRRRAQADGKSGGHVTRRPDDPVPDWHVGHWSMTVSDILDGGVEGYGDRVRAWARSVIEDLEALP